MAASGVLAAEPAPTAAPAAAAPTAGPGTEPTPTTDPSAADERVIVLLAPGASSTAEASAARDAGIEVGRTYKSAVQAFTATVSPTEELRAGR